MGSFLNDSEASVAVSGVVLFFEPGNGVRGKGAAFEPSCLAQLWRSSKRCCALAPRACAWPVACAALLRCHSSVCRCAGESRDWVREKSVVFV